MSENDYHEQPANQEEAVRPEVNMLPCKHSVQSWFGLMFGCFFLALIVEVISVLLVEETGNYMNEESINITSSIITTLLDVPGLVFLYFFAQGCRGLRHSENIYIWILFFLPIILNILSFLPIEETVYLFIFLGSLLAFSIVVALLAHSLFNNYYGDLSYAGEYMRNALKYFLFTIGAAAVFIIRAVHFNYRPLYAHNDFDFKLLIWGAAALILCIIASVYAYKALYRIYRILEAGHMYHFTDAGLEAILDGKTFVPPILDTATNDGASSTAAPASAGAPKEPGGWSRLPSWARFLIIFGGVLAVTGIIILIAMVSDKGHPRDDYNDLHEELYESYDDGEEEDYEHSNQIYNEDDENYNPYAEYGGKPLPGWLPDNIREDLESSNYVFTHSDGDMGLSDTYRGNINDSEIVMELSYNSDGTVTGRYAYESTLSRYGYGDSSWYKLRGAVFFAEASYPRVVLRSYTPDSGKLFEYFDLTDEDMTLNGTMFNVRHLETPEKSLYRVYLERYRKQALAP